jgi:hypothetical protein
MHADAELARLAACKVALQVRIGRRRVQCRHAAARVARPLVGVDRLLALGRTIAPLVRNAAVSLAIIRQRKMTPRLGLLGSVVRWAPLVFGVARGITHIITSKTRPLAR